MVATGLVYRLLGGPLMPVEFAGLARPLVGAIATYFFVNTGLVAAAIAATTQSKRLESLARGVLVERRQLHGGGRGGRGGCSGHRARRALDGAC